MEKPEEMFWPAQYTEYNIEEKIVIMLENVLENFFFFTKLKDKEWQRKKNCNMWWWMLTNFIIVIISQHLQILNHYIVHPKLIPYFMSNISQFKNIKRKLTIILKHLHLITERLPKLAQNMCLNQLLKKEKIIKTNYS